LLSYRFPPVRTTKDVGPGRAVCQPPHRLELHSSAQKRGPGQCLLTSWAALNGL